MNKKKIERIVAREGLIIAGLAVTLYLFIHLFLQNVPVALPRYKVEFANGETHVITIYPEISNKHNYKRLLEEAYNPPQKLIDKRISEFIKAEKIKSVSTGAKCINSRKIYTSRLYSYILGRTFIVKLAIIYLFLLFIRFIIWAMKILKTK